MAIEIKRQQLLNKNKKPKPKQTNPKDQTKVPQEAQQSQQQSTKVSKKVSAKKKSSAGSRIFQVFLALFFVGLIIVPKPKLIVYKKLSLVANSIYIPGWFGSPGYMLDSTQRVIIDESLNIIYFCYAKDLPKEQCNRYEFIEKKGMFSALWHYYQNNMSS